MTAFAGVNLKQYLKNLIKTKMTIKNKLVLTQELIELFLKGEITEETFNATIIKLG